MCKAIADMIEEKKLKGRKEGAWEEKKKTALRMLSAGKYALEEIVTISGLSLEEVKQLKSN